MNLERVSGIGRPSSGVPTARKSRGRGDLPPGPPKVAAATEGGSDQLPASRLFIHNFDLLVGQLADETIYHQRCLAEASCQGRMHPVMPFIMACR
jgi:hypothetical protein